MEDQLSVTIRDEYAKIISLLQRMAADPAMEASIRQVVALCTQALAKGNKLMFAGNGGSAADAQHWAGELVSRFNFDRPGLAAIALTTDTSILTAIGNDYGYDYVFARQVEALARPGDVLLVITTSGGSKNILRAVTAARAHEVSVVGFTGARGGEFAALCDHCFVVPSTETPKIQEGHEFLGHLICGLIEHEVFGGPGRA
jgi:D-sedoheptulose 7-phosphate isomerase